MDCRNIEGFGCLRRTVFSLGVLALLVTVLAFVFDLPEKLDWFTGSKTIPFDTTQRREQ